MTDILKAYKKQQKKRKKKKSRETCFDCKGGEKNDSVGNPVPQGRTFCKFQQTVVLCGTARSCPFFKETKKRR